MIAQKQSDEFGYTADFLTSINFSTKFETWVIAFCADTNSFFCSDERYFFWEYSKEFNDEQLAINFFRENISCFIDKRQEIISKTGGVSKESDIFLENTRESWDVFGNKKENK